MPKPDPTRADDIRILTALHLTEAEGMTAREAGAVLGMTKDAVLGARRRVMLDLARSEGGSSVTRPENADGAMGAMWWA